MKDPSTPEEWQEAVNLAEAMLRIDAARQYGLLEGGPSINAKRSAEILTSGARLKVHPEENEVVAIGVAMAMRGGP